MGRKTTTLLNTIASNRPQRPSITAPKSHVKTITAPLKIGHHLNYRSNSTAHQLLPQQITNIIVIKRTTVHVKRTVVGLTWDFKMLVQKFNYPLDIHQNYKLNVLNCNDNLYNTLLECGSTSRKPLVDNSNTFKVSFFIGNKFAGKNDKSWNRQRSHWPTVPIMRPKNYPPEAKRIQKFLWHKVHFLLSNKKRFSSYDSQNYTGLGENSHFSHLEVIQIGTRHHQEKWKLTMRQITIRRTIFYYEQSMMMTTFIFRNTTRDSNENNKNNYISAQVHP